MFLRKILPVLIACLLHGNVAVAMDPQPADVQGPVEVEFYELQGQTAPVSALATLSTDQKTNYIISGSEDGTIRVWDFDTGGCIHVLGGHTAAITSVKAIQQESGDIIIVSGSLDGTIRLWDAQTGRCTAMLPHGDGPFAPILALEVIYKQDHIASLAENGSIDIWNIPSKSLKTSFKHDQAKFLSYAGLSSVFFSASGTEVKVWDIGEKTCDATITIEGKVCRLTGFFQSPNLFVSKTLSDPSFDSYDLFDWLFTPGEKISHYDNNDLTLDMIRYSVFDYNGDCVLVCSNQGVFKVYALGKKISIAWSGIDATNKFVPHKVAYLAGHLIYISKDTNSLMVSCDPVLLKVAQN